jgi:hypothetical protein
MNNFRHGQALSPEHARCATARPVSVRPSRSKKFNTEMHASTGVNCAGLNHLRDGLTLAQPSGRTLKVLAQAVPRLLLRRGAVARCDTPLLTLKG